MGTVLEISGLCKRYKNFALEDVNLTLPGGTVMGLIGENGAGKSTTLRCILNLTPIDGGSIQVFEKNHAKDERAIKDDVGVVLDACPFHEMFTTRDVEKIMRGIYKKWDTALFLKYMEQFELPAKSKIKEFSRGMKMKLAIAAALSHHPKLLLLDEATGGLDPVVRSEILDEFLNFAQDEEHAVLISSHITSDLEKVADYVSYLHKGRVAVQGAKDELLEQYGRLVCTKAQLAQVDASLLVGGRAGQFGGEALVRDRAQFAKYYPQLLVEPVSLEEIMLFTVKGDAQ